MQVGERREGETERQRGKERKRILSRLQAERGGGVLSQHHEIMT